jgi:hypothetical protein
MDGDKHQCTVISTRLNKYNFRFLTRAHTHRLVCGMDMFDMSIREPVSTSSIEGQGTDSRCEHEAPSYGVVGS